MNDKIKITAIILAAGQSSRMGTIKQLLPWEGTTLIKHVINQSLQSKVNNTIVVLGAFREQIIADLYDMADIDIVENTQWKAGMISSINAGIRACHTTTNAILVLLADQPAVDTNYINSLIDSYMSDECKKSIIATRYEDNIGVPALFSKHFFDVLKASQLQSGGANHIIKSNMNMVKTINPTFKLYDLDTMEDYKHYS